ncbi:MAG: hypothetical protein PHO42_04885 [Candidatus Omnitrophica bacterium]|nr:hypothetical protein [Candidatus Omnitrophota bacterium]
MGTLKTKSLERLEQRMDSVDKGSFRYQVLDHARNFKTSWISLGQALYTVYKDRLYKDWGFLTFEAYAAREIGIHKQTAVKLLKSYYFLEKEEPAYLRKGNDDAGTAASLPTYEAINALRLAKNKKGIEEKDYEDLKKQVFEKGKEVGEVRKAVCAFIRQRDEASPEEARKKRTEAALKRYIGTLKTLRRELEISKLFSAAILNETDALIKKIESEI